MAREDEMMKKQERGDCEALDELIEFFYPDILRYCLWHAPDRALAEDAAQETFLKTVRSFDRYESRGKIKPYLYKIAANTCIDMRRTSRQTDISLEEAAVEPIHEEAGFEQAQSDAAFQQMVAALPTEQRELVILRFAQDLTLREIAEIADLPLRTVQSRLRAALKTLKKEITQGGAR